LTEQLILVNFIKVFKIVAVNFSYERRQINKPILNYFYPLSILGLQTIGDVIAKDRVYKTFMGKILMRGQMETIFDSCQPRDEVLKGELKDEIFRASLSDVHKGVAEDVYKDPKTFFDHTYRTDGLKTLLKEALGRLTGEKAANSSVIRLETSFGGGKTHNLIALYHLANGKVSHDMVSDLLPPELLPQKPVLVIPLIGSDLDPSSGMNHGKITTYTLWGEMAYEVGGLDSVP